MTGAPSFTAESVALFRAIETARPPEQRILVDPYAVWFLRPTLARLAPLPGAEGLVGRITRGALDGVGPLPGSGELVHWIAARHRFLDECMLSAVAAGAEQVVVLGAGYDMRAYRFHEQLRDRAVFEVDHPSTARRKVAIVEQHAAELPPSGVRRVEIDFLTQRLADVLPAAGFRTGAATVFLWEGVSMYLTRAAVEDTLTCLRTLGGEHTRLGMDLWHMVDTPGIRGAAYRLAPNLLGLIGESITLSVHPKDAPALLGAAGFAIDDLASPAELMRRYGCQDRSADPANYAVSAHAVATAG
jgi:methyltransferase (TIGR00027 family)